MILFDTAARTALAAALKPAGQLSQTDLARQLGVKQPTVSKWVHGVCRPDPHLRLALAVILGIPGDDWLVDAEREQVAALRAVAGSSHGEAA